MCDSTELDSLAVLEETQSHDVSTRGNGPMVIRWRQSAENDATCEDPPMPKDKIDAWLRDALAADGGLRDALAADGVDAAATTDTTSCMRPTSYELYHAARAHRSFALGELIVVATKTAGAIARRAHERHRQHQKTNATSGALRQLDDGTLRDLGFDRSEIGSIAAELSGEAEYTRVRTLPTHAPKRVPIHAIRS